MKKIILSLFLLSAFVSYRSQTVTTQYGTVQGSMSGTVYQFLGIPFASPPVGNLRWKAPQNPAAWAGVLNTTSFAPMCTQKKFSSSSTSYTYTGSEDCLYLNVWTPQTSNPNLPVMVFIHGGGNQQGGASEDGGGTQMYIGKNLSERGNAVVVTIQYRLGPLGFLVHPGLEPETATNKAGNYAVMDQILALKWVKNNISNFGGDTTKVMVFGESAGGLNVGNLLNTPSAAGLFSRACIESASPVLGVYSTERSKGVSFVDSFINTGTAAQKIAFMRSLPADSVVKFSTPPLSGGAVGMNWLSVIDSVYFFDKPFNNFQNGTFNKVPLMLGSNAEEMSISSPPTVTPLMVNLLINTTVPTSLQTQAATLYPPGTNTAQARDSYVGILTDAQFTAPARRMAKCVSLNQTDPVWRYFFSFKHTVAALTPLGSYHGMELFYIFNNWENAALGTGPLFKPQDDSVQKVMLKYWVNFASTGNPNGSNLVNWPQYAAAGDCYIELKATPNGTQCGLRTTKSDLWDNSVSYVPCISTLNVKELYGNETFSLYPNPNNGSFTIEASSTCKVTIVDVLGKNVVSTQIDQGKNHVDMANVDPGIYFVRIDKDGRSMAVKFIKE